jgi:hypothetical protein
MKANAHRESKMDPITVAIIAALANLSQSVIKDAYTALKVAIAQKCGVDSDLLQAIDKLEGKPDSAGRKEVLREEVAAAKADKDPELTKLAETLLGKLKDLPNGQTVITQTVKGDRNIFSGTGDVTVTHR